MKFVDFGFPEDKILGTFRTNCPGWKVKIKEAKFLGFAPGRWNLYISVNGRCWTFEERR
jgi:hypothetical protein